MGQTASSNQPEPDLEGQPEPKYRIDTADKFQSTFNYEFRHECLGVYERNSLRKAFGFDSNTEFGGSEGNLAWDERALTEFLSAAVPAHVKSDLEVAGPLLLKSMIRLGSFPFHNRQTRSMLGADEAFVAIAFLLRMHEESTEFTFDEEEEEEDDRDKVRQIRDVRFRRLMFQVMADKPESDSQHKSPEEDETSARNPADDEHLIIAHRFVKYYNTYGRDERNPKRAVKLPPIIEVSELPSSRSNDLTGTIPKEEFRALLKVLCGTIKRTSINVDQLIESHGTAWHGFDAILTELEPFFTLGFRQLFEVVDCGYVEWDADIRYSGIQEAGTK
ncbi:hypothetical protein F5Y04DRAFT_247688 [Hypomontagnella monticulosa]|nr:hypothetical protein F5Y04DRAFT_247688 [Hypomontagnella monticulosa]